MFRKSIPLFIAASLMLSGCAINNNSTKTDSTTANTVAEEYSKDIQKILDKMTVEEKAAQMLFVRCDSNNIDGMLSKHPGGIVMFAVDFDGLTEKEVKDKIKHLKSDCDIEPFIAVDEEGGTVVRVSSNPSLSPEKYKSPQYYYNAGGMEAVISNTAEKSQLLADLGITMNLAPVADISTNPDDFMYDRSFGQDSAATAEFVARVVNTMKENNMMSCLKHFPGYGGNVDTHTGIAVDDRTLDSFRANDFMPFKAGIEAGADAVLVAHNIVTNIDSELPASISPSVHDILRNELNFDGIILTDDMSMGAMQDYINPYKKAVLAGNDMIIVSDFDAALDEIVSSVADGSITEDILDSAVLNILSRKKL